MEDSSLPDFTACICSSVAIYTQTDTHTSYSIVYSDIICNITVNQHVQLSMDVGKWLHLEALQSSLELLLVGQPLSLQGTVLWEMVTAEDSGGRHNRMTTLYHQTQILSL